MSDPYENAQVLRTELEPLWDYLQDELVTELSINRPGELWIERLGQHGMERVENSSFSKSWIHNIGAGVASYSNQVVNAERPILSSALPSGERFQCVLAPAASEGGAISIRKQVIKDMTIEDYERLGAFKNTRMGTGLNLSEDEEKLIDMMASVQPMEWLRYAVENRISIVVSGGTSTGKTTFLNALLKFIPIDERIITIEDTRELKPYSPNRLFCVSSKGDQGLAKVTAQDLLEASLRMRPDRLMLGELRGAETFAFLQAINTGHPGSITTVHANSPRAAYERLALMVMQSGVGLQRHEIMDYLREVIPIVVQMRRMPDGSRVISEIAFSKTELK